MAYYSKTIQEEELKNKVREEWFAGYDNTDIPGKVDFYVGYNGTTYLWAEAKRGVKPKSVIRISLCRTAKRNPLIFPI